MGNPVREVGWQFWLGICLALAGAGLLFLCGQEPPLDSSGALFLNPERALRPIMLAAGYAFGLVGILAMVFGIAESK